MTTGEPLYEPQGTMDLPPEYDAQAGTTTGAQQLTETAKDSVQKGADQVKHTVMSQAATQKDQAAHGLDTVSGAVNQAAQQLRQSNQEPMARAAESVASNIGQFADYLRSRSVGDLIGEAEDFASRQPTLFLSGAFLVGVLGARFLKSSRSGMSQSSSSQQWQGARMGTGYQANQYTPQSRPADAYSGTPMSGTGMAGRGRDAYPADDDIIARENPR